MARFQDLGEFFDETLTLPIKGTEYVVPSPSAELGLAVESIVMRGGQLTDDEIELLTDDEERDLYARLLGPAHAEMIENGVPWSMIQHAGKTAMIWIAMGQEAAERAWLGKGLTDPTPANRAERRRSTRTAAGSKTPARASTSGTRSRRPTSAASARTSSRTKKS